MSTRTKPGKLWWSFLATWGLVFPACILFLRLSIACPGLELKAFDFLPLSGVVKGYSPHLLYRIMHDLTHPILLLAYCAATTYIASRPIFRPVSERLGWFLNYMLPLQHFAFFASYVLSMFLPVGDMIETVSPQ